MFGFGILFLFLSIMRSKSLILNTNIVFGDQNVFYQSVETHDFNVWSNNNLTYVSTVTGNVTKYQSVRYSSYYLPYAYSGGEYWLSCYCGDNNVLVSSVTHKTVSFPNQLHSVTSTSTVMYVAVYYYPNITVVDSSTGAIKGHLNYYFPTVANNYNGYNSIAVSSDGTILYQAYYSIVYAVSTSSGLLLNTYTICLVNSYGWYYTTIITDLGFSYLKANNQNHVVIEYFPLTGNGLAGTCPTPLPTSLPTINPTAAPSKPPTAIPSAPLLKPPTAAPTGTHSYSPTSLPSLLPTAAPTLLPSIRPSVTPSAAPTIHSSFTPSMPPSVTPSVHPSFAPSPRPTVVPITGSPSLVPSSLPFVSPSRDTTSIPSLLPSDYASASPTIHRSFTPTSSPSVTPSVSHSFAPTFTSAPSTTVPTATPTVDASHSPTATLQPFQVVVANTGHTDGTLSGGTLYGVIAAAVITGVLCMLLCLFFLLRRQSKEKDQAARRGIESWIRKGEDVINLNVNLGAVKYEGALAGSGHKASLNFDYKDNPMKAGSVRLPADVEF